MERDKRLIYDLANCAWIEGHLLDEDDQHLRHMVMDMCEAGNIDRVRELIALARGEVPRQVARTPMAREYVLCRVMHDWLAIVHPAAAPKWEEKMREAYASLLSAQIACSFTRQISPF